MNAEATDQSGEAAIGRAGRDAIARVVDVLFALLWVGGLFLYHWVVRRPLEPHNHVADLGLVDFTAVTLVVWLGQLRRRDALRETALVELSTLSAAVVSFVVLAYGLFQIDYMLCRQAWLPCAGTGPGISGYLAAFVALSAVLVARDAVLLRWHRGATRVSVRPVVTFTVALVVLYLTYRATMPDEPRHRLVFDLVFLLALLVCTVGYGVADGRATARRPGA